jgi:hypothetical protein
MTALIVDFCLRPPIWCICNSVLKFAIIANLRVMIFSMTFAKQLSNEIIL